MSFHIFCVLLKHRRQNWSGRTKKPHSSRVRPKLKLKNCYQRCFQLCDPAHNAFKARDTVHDAVDTILSPTFHSVDLPDHCCVDLMDLMQNIKSTPIHSSLVEQAVLDDPLSAVKLLIQFYRICYAVHVVNSSGAIAMVCHILFLLYDNV